MATSGTPIQKPQQNSHGNKTSGRKTILQLLFLAASFTVLFLSSFMFRFLQDFWDK